MKTRLLSLLLVLSGAAGPASAAAEVAGAEAGISQADPFAAGRVWAGQRRVGAKEGGGGQGRRWSLHIETREGEKFTGYIVLRNTPGNTVRISVAGSAPSDGAGYVGFGTTEPKGELRQRYTGTLKNDFIELSCTGRGLTGEEVSGTAGLSPRKKDDD